MIIDELIAILGYDVQGEGDLKRFNNGLKEAEENARALAERIGRGVAIAGAAMAAGLAFLGKNVLDTGAQFESLGVRLEALEGSAEKGRQALDWIREFAEETPLSLSEAAEAYARLRTFGVDPTNGSLLAAVDTMAMSGQGADYLSGVILAMGQAWTKGKLQGEEALQLIERNVPVWDLLAEKMGITSAAVQELSQKGKLGRKEMKLLFDAMGKRAQGQSAKAAKTWTGLIGRLGDKWEGFLKLIADAGVFEETKRIIENTLGTIERWFADGRAQRAARFFSDIFISIARAVDRVSGQIARHMQFIVDNIDTLRPYLYGLAAVFGVLLAATFPVTTALLGIAAVIDDILTYLEGGDSVFGDFVKWLQDVTGLSKGAAEAMAGLGTAIVTGLGIGLVALLPRLVARLALLFVTGFASGVAGLAGGAAWAILRAFFAAFGAIQFGASLVALLIRSIITALPALAVQVVPALAAAFAFLLTPAGWAVIVAGIGAALVAYFWDDIVANAPKLVAAGAEMGKALLEGIKSIGGAIADWFAGLVPDWAKGILAPVPGTPARPKDSETAPQYNFDKTAPGRGRDKAGSTLVPDWAKGTPPTLDRSAAPVRGIYPVAPSAPDGQPAPGRGRYKIGSTPLVDNFAANMAKMSSGNAGAAVVNDNRQDNRQYPVSVQAPVTVHVQQASQAPAAVGGAVAGAINQAAQAQPSRMQTGPAQ